jgi:hypothetical protein
MRCRFVFPAWSHLGLALLLAALACGSERAEDADAARAQTLAAIPVLRSAADVDFSQITGLDVDERGQIIVGDAMNEVVVLGPDGRSIRRFGRGGDGPGEFQAVSTVYLLPGDSLYVYDGYAQRATVYAPHSDRVAYTIRLPQPDFSFATNVEPRPDGYLLAHFRRINGDVPGAGQQRHDVVRTLNADGSIRRDSVLLVREPEVVQIQSGGQNGFFFPRFARQSFVRWGPDGRIYSMWSDSTRVHVHDARGRSRGSFVARIPFPRLPLAESSIDSVWEMNADGGFDRRTFTQAFRSRWQTWPLVQDMLVDDRSRVWIQPVTQGPDARWLAFDSGGVQFAALTLPRGVQPRLIRGDRMYAVSKDSLDVESVVVYRLEPSSTPTRENR